jgi:hypothetical protein
MCEQYNWQTILKSNFTFSENPSSLAKDLTILPNDIYIHDYDTGLITNKESVINNKTKLTMNDTTNECICDLLIEELNFKFIVDSSLFQITTVYLDIVLGKNIKGKCTDKKLLSKKTSVDWLGTLKTTTRSGNPGYTMGSNLLVSYNVTDNQTAQTIFQTDRNGHYMVGRGVDNSCMKGNDNLIGSSYDTPLKFGVNNIYGCNMNMTLAQFTSFCLEQQWKDLKLFNFPKNIQYLGVFGNAQLNYAKVR